MPNQVDVWRWITNEDKVNSLPGVPEALKEYQEELREYEARHSRHGRSQGLETSASTVFSATRSADLVERNKPVGRFQRIVRWTVCDCLIILDWRQIRSQNERLRTA